MVRQLLEIEARDRNHPHRGWGRGDWGFINKSSAQGFSGQRIELKLNSPGGWWEGKEGAFLWLNINVVFSSTLLLSPFGLNMLPSLSTALFIRDWSTCLPVIKALWQHLRPLTHFYLPFTLKNEDGMRKSRCTGIWATSPAPPPQQLCLSGQQQHLS